MGGSGTEDNGSAAPAELIYSDDEDDANRDPTGTLAGIEDTADAFQAQLNEKTRMGARTTAGKACRGAPDATFQSG